MLNISPILSSPQICDSNGYTVLHTACSRAGIAAEQIIQKLVSAGAELNTTNKFCRTALHECVISNNMAGARIILGGGASKDILDSEGRTPKDLAVSRDCLEMVELLSSENTSEVSVKEKAREVEVSNPSPLGACALPKMTVEEEKEALRRRLAELEEGETKSLESSLKEKRLALEKVKVDFRKQREIARAEIFKLEQKIKVLNVLCEYPRIGH